MAPQGGQVVEIESQPAHEPGREARRRERKPHGHASVDVRERPVKTEAAREEEREEHAHGHERLTRRRLLGPVPSEITSTATSAS